jgi:hypothetical protein
MRCQSVCQNEFLTGPRRDSSNPRSELSNILWPTFGMRQTLNCRHYNKKSHKK